MEIYCAIHEGKALCCFSTPERCKSFIKANHPNLDPFDIIIKKKYLYDYKQSTASSYLDR